MEGNLFATYSTYCIMCFAFKATLSRKIKAIRSLKLNLINGSGKSVLIYALFMGNFLGQIYPGKNHLKFYMSGVRTMNNFTWKWQICPPLNKDLHRSLSIKNSRKNLLREKKLLFSFSSSAILTCDSASTIVACFKQERASFSFPNEVFTTWTSTFG